MGNQRHEEPQQAPCHRHNRRNDAVHTLRPGDKGDGVVRLLHTAGTAIQEQVVILEESANEKLDG